MSEERIVDSIRDAEAEIQEAAAEAEETLEAEAEETVEEVAEAAETAEAETEETVEEVAEAAETAEAETEETVEEVAEAAEETTEASPRAGKHAAPGGLSPKAVIALVVIAVVLAAAIFGIARNEMKKQAAAEAKAKAQAAAEQKAKEAAEKARQEQKIHDTALAMSNHNDESQCFMADGEIYYMDFDVNGEALLVRAKPGAEEADIVKENSDVAFLGIYDNYIYCIIWTRDQGSALYKMTKDGLNAESLITGAVDYQIVDDKIYYNKASASGDDFLNIGYFCCDLDGTNESMVLSKETYDNFVIDGKVYYQDEEDGQTIHVYDLETEKDEQLTKTHSHGFVVDGETAYYIDTGDTGDVTTGTLTELDMKTGDTTALAGEAYRDVLLVLEDQLIYCDGENNYRITAIDKGESGKREVSEIDNPDYVCCYEDKLLFYDFDGYYQYTEGVYCCDLDGSELERLDG